MVIYFIFIKFYLSFFHMINFIEDNFVFILIIFDLNSLFIVIFNDIFIFNFILILYY